jgi:hypothetical protein
MIDQIKLFEIAVTFYKIYSIFVDSKFFCYKVIRFSCFLLMNKYHLRYLK